MLSTKSTIVVEGKKIGRTCILPIKVSNFAEMFILGYLLRKNMAPRETQTLTLAGAIRGGGKGRGGGYIKYLQLITQ